MMIRYLFVLSLGASGAGAQQQTMGPPPPLFGYHEISVTNLAGLAPHIQINPNVSCTLNIKVTSLPLSNFV